MFRSLQLSAALALVLSSAACSSAGRPAGAAPASSLPVATELRGESEPAAAAPLRAAASAAPVELGAPAPAPASRRASPAAPLSALTQIVTAQALLVSLLLAPLSSTTAAPERAEGLPLSAAGAPDATRVAR